MATWGKNATATGLVGAALVAAVAAFSSGCGGGGGFFAVPNDRFFTPTPTQTGTATATPTPTPSPNGGPANEITGTITLGTGVSNEPTITLFQAGKQVAQTTAAANGSYSFPNLTPGAYTILLTGTGLREQFDTVNLTAGSGFTLNYAMSALSGAPSQQEVTGISASALHIARAFYGTHLALPLANGLLNFNELITARGGQTFTGTNIAVSGAQQVAIDSNGHAWVTDAVGNDGEVTVLSNTGTLVGQFPSNGSNPNQGAQPIAIDSNNDVAVANNGTGTFGVFPAADVHSVNISQNEVILGQTANAIAAQNGAVGKFTGPHFVATQTIPDGGGTTVPALFFFDKNSVQASSSAIAGLAVNSTVQGVAVASDNTIFVAANIASSGTTSPHILHLSADGSTIVENIDLTASPFNLVAGNTVQFVALDSSTNIFVGGSTGVLKIGGTAGARTLAGSNATVPAGLTIDSANNVWITNGTVATQFDDNLANPSTGTVAAGAGSVAVDANGNAFVVSSGANQVTRLTVGSAVGPKSGNSQTTLPDGSQVTTAVANGTTTLTQTFTGGAQNQFSFGATTVSGVNSQVTLSGTAAFGPTTSTILASVSDVTGLTTYTVDATNGIDGVVIKSSVEVNLDASESVSGTSSEGLSYSATYNAPSTADGSVFMKGTWADSTTNDNGTIQLTFNANGSLEAFTLVDNTRQLVVTSNSSGAAYTSTVTVLGSQTVQGTATSNPFQDLLLAFVKGTSPDPLGNFLFQNVSTTSGVDFLNQGMTVTQADNSTTTIAAAQLTTDTSTPVTGQGDGPDMDAGTGAGTFIANDGGGGGIAIR